MIIKNTRKTRILTTLLSATCLSAVGTGALAVPPNCPAASGGTITVNGSSDYCYINTGESLVVTSTGHIEGGGLRGAGYDIDPNPTGTITVEEGGIIDSGEGGVLFSDGATFGGITNSGTIQGIGGGGDSSGIIFDDGATVGYITNNGLVSSASSNGIEIINGAEVTGAITNNLGADINAENIGISIGGTVGSIVNSGDIIADSRGIALFTGTIEGALTNNASGKIAGNNSGIEVVGSSIEGGFVNKGTVEGSYRGVQIRSSSEITGFTNDTGASIKSTSYGRGVEIDESTVSNFLNKGTIEGVEGGLLFSEATFTGTFKNQGIIRATDMDGVALEIYDSTFNTTGNQIENSGTLSSDDNAIYVDNQTDPLNIVNTGTIDGNVYINGATLKLNAGSNLTQMGSVNGANGTLDVATAYTANADYSLKAINLKQNANLTVANNNSFTVSQSVFNDKGILTVNNGKKLTVNGTYEQSVDGIFRTKLKSTSEYGQMDVNGTAMIAANSVIDVDVVSGNNIAVGNKFVDVITADNLAASSFKVTDNSYLFNFTSEIDGDSAHLVAEKDTSSSVTQSVIDNSNNPGLGAAKKLDSIIAGNPGGDWDEVINAFGTLQSSEQVSNAVSQTLPTLTGGTANAIINTADTTSKIVQARADANSGISSGEDFETSGNFWMKPFGSWASQSNKDGVIGYDAESYGLIAGVDSAVSEDVRLGLAGAYSNTSLNSNSNTNTVNVDNFQAIFYGSHTLAPKTELNFQTDVGYGTSDSKRTINFGGLTDSASGEYDSWNFHAGLGVGHVVDLSPKTTIVPSARVDYFIVRNDGYSETGAGVLNQNVDSQTVDQLIPAVEAKLNHDIQQDVTISLNGGVGYDLINEQSTVTSSFAGGGGVFVTNGLEPSPWVVRSGAGLTVDQSENLEITARYDREDRGADYDNQTVSLKARMPF